jgi:hypothetical protein
MLEERASKGQEPMRVHALNKEPRLTVIGGLEHCRPRTYILIYLNESQKTPVSDSYYRSQVLEYLTLSFSESKVVVK